MFENINICKDADGGYDTLSFERRVSKEVRPEDSVSVGEAYKDINISVVL